MAPAADLTAWPPVTSETPHSGFTALVADDDPGLRGLLSSYLAGEGLTVDTASTGEEAIARLNAQPPDMVFLDVEMPGRRGLDVLNEIRQRRLQTAVIITTAYGTEETVIDALRRGTDDYLKKPFDEADVQAVVDRTMARLLLSRQNAELRARIREQQLHLEQEMTRAKQVIAELLPAHPAPVPGFGMAAACLSAQELGGDFYDWQYLPNGALSLTVGDVMGKGLPAALLMATVRGVLRALVAEGSPGDVVQRTAHAIDHDLSRSGAFVTLFHAQIDVSTGIVRYVDAGHGYVLLRRADGRVEELRPWGLPIGVDSEERYCEGSVQLDPGDTLLIYSDGLAEARPDRFADRASVASYAAGEGDATEIVDRLMSEVAEVRPLPDDLTVVAVRRQPLGAVV